MEEIKTKLNIITVPDPILKSICTPCELNEETWQLANDMIQFMVENPSINRHTVGLSAPQIGKSFQLFVMRPTPNYKINECTIVVNPKIVNHGKSKSTMTESCLSVPGKAAAKERYEIIEVEYTTQKELIRETLKYYTARIFQHEYDHLQGILIGD